MSRLHVLVMALAILTVATAQRVIPPSRLGGVPSGHLQVKPQNVRGTYFVLARNESAESFWSRYEDNRASSEFRMAILVHPPEIPSALTG